MTIITETVTVATTANTTTTNTNDDTTDLTETDYIDIEVTDALESSGGIVVLEHHDHDHDHDHDQNTNTNTTIIINNNSNNDNDGGDDGDDEESTATATTTRTNNNTRSWRLSSSCRSHCSVQKLIVGLILLGLIVFVIVDSLTTQTVQAALGTFLLWIEVHPGLGVLAFMAVYACATICFVPGTILTLGAGFVFATALDSLGYGMLLATTSVFVGASIGAIASFLLGRYLFRDGFVTRLTHTYPIFEAIDNALEDKGFRIMILLRLSPIIPFNVLNYVSGMTGIRFVEYSIACLAMLPATFLYVFLGASAGSLSEIGNDEEAQDDDDDNNNTVTIVVIVVGVIFGILAVAVTSYYAKQELTIVLEKKKNGTTTTTTTTTTSTK